MAKKKKFFECDLCNKEFKSKSSMLNHRQSHFIIEDVFSFLKYRCGYCGKKMKSNKNFCSINCQASYFEKMNRIKIKTQINKKTQSKRHVFKLSDILNEGSIQQMIEESERNINIKMKKMRR